MKHEIEELMLDLLTLMFHFLNLKPYLIKKEYADTHKRKTQAIVQ